LAFKRYSKEGRKIEEKGDKKDIGLIKAALRQEIEAERRYAKHLANVNNKRVRKVLKELHKAEGEHNNRLIGEMKKRMPSFNPEKNELWNMEMNPEMLEGIGDNVELIKTIIEINIEKEKEALKQYKGYAREADSDELKQLFLEFSKEEDEHRQKLYELDKEFSE